MKSSLLIILAVGFAGFGALEVAALNPDAKSGNAADTQAIADKVAVANKPESAAGLKLAANRAHLATDKTCLTPALAAAFEPRQLQLDQRSAKLDLRQAELQDLETTIQARLADMEATRASLQAMTERLDVVADKDIAHLVEMYSTMKPKNAAAIFDRMDPAFAAGFLREIDSARAGVIMAEMGEEQSYRVSLLIANRHAEWRNKR
ncbi:hypothetical protein GCM10007853_22060 [Algimonas ampicilliniresistens]|uniref:Magnesium transporter MgtE intracellular domain-containing protein n=1 Tax=Algimonas ampicilliniresistens TaxID=1298735 RepID=A0ABQ5VBH0_9PROT|nr:hypothetical protein [Algimonas ampicilliniresistens]GLQ24332.1 hypothetical protein GCM10007853_22060 [Algimonas ampicilliniresistens]